MDETNFTEDMNALYRLGISRGLNHHQALSWARWCVTPSQNTNQEIQ